METTKHNNIKDESLIENFLNGDELHFNILYNRYKNQLYAYLNRFLSNQGTLVDDIFQQTWIKVIHKLDKYNNQKKFLSWVIQIAHNLAIDYFRKEKRLVNSVEIDDERDTLIKDTKNIGDHIDDKFLKKELNKALEVLSSEQKEVFLLRQEGISFKEISKIQNCSINTALARMQYALKSLKDKLSKFKKR